MKKIISLIAALSMLGCLTLPVQGVVFAAEIDTSAAEEAPTELEGIAEKLTEFIEQKGYAAFAEIAAETEVAVAFPKQADGAEFPGFAQIIQEISDFLAENQIDMTPYDCIISKQCTGMVSLKTAANLGDIEKLLAYIAQNGYDARVEVHEEPKTVITVFSKKPMGEPDYDYAAIEQEFQTFLAENQIDTSVYHWEWFAEESGTAEPSADTEETQPSADAEETQPSADAEQTQPSADAEEKQPVSEEELLRWVKIDYEKKLGVAVYPEITAKSDTAYTFAVKDAGGNVLDTYTIDPETGIGTDASGGEVNLPQTGMSGIYRAAAALAACMSIAGAGLVRRSRRDDRE